MALGIVSVAVIPPLVCLFLALTLLPPLLEQLAQEKPLKMAESLATTLNTILEERQQQTKAIALDPQIGQAAANQRYDEIQNKLLHKYSDRFGPQEGFFVADRDGIVRVDNTGTKSQGHSIGDRTYFVLAKSGATAMSEPFYSTISGRPLLIFCHPLINDDRFNGIIGLALDLSALQQLVNAVKLGQTGYSLLLDKEGVFVSHPESKYILKTNALTLSGIEKLAQQMTGLSSGIEDFIVTGEHRTAGFAPVPVVGWSIAVTQARDELLAPTRKATRWALVFTLVVLTLSALLALFVFKRLFSPVKRLSRAAQTLSNQRGVSFSENNAHTNLDNVIDSMNMTAPSLRLQLSAILKDSQRQSDALFYSDQSIKPSEDLLSAFSQSEKGFQEFYERAAEGIFQASLKGQIQVVNNALVRMLGYESKQELRSAFCIIEEHLFSETSLRHLSEQQDLEATEIKLNRKDGEDCWISFSASLIRDNGGKRLAIKGVVADINERKRQEFEMLWLNQQLEHRVQERTAQLDAANRELKAAQSKLLQQEKMASIEQLAAGVAHELNTPLGYIISNLGTMHKYQDKVACYLDILIEIFKNLDDNKNRASDILSTVLEQKKNLNIEHITDDLGDLIDETLEGAQRIHSIVRDLKIFAEVNDDQFILTDINNCLDSSIASLEVQIPEGIEIRKDYSQLQELWCNRGQLNRAFHNILLNSIQSIDKLGKIGIETRMIEGKAVRIIISDTGEGIPATITHRIFDPFFTTKDVGQGTGLGLSIVYEIISRHQGSIDIESSPGSGTTLSIDLPIHQEGLSLA
jgi:PAS domain S-box-containing protein